MHWRGKAKSPGTTRSSPKHSPPWFAVGKPISSARSANRSCSTSSAPRSWNWSRPKRHCKSHRPHGDARQAVARAELSGAGSARRVQRLPLWLGGGLMTPPERPTDRSPFSRVCSDGVNSCVPHGSRGAMETSGQALRRGPETRAEQIGRTPRSTSPAFPPSHPLGFIPFPSSDAGARPPP